MADPDLNTLLHTLPLSSSEETLLNIPSEELAADLCNRSLIGKFQAREEVIIQNLKSSMVLGWESDFSTINLQKNVYQFIFESKEKLTQILENGPWCFDGHLVVLRKWRDDWESCKFDVSEFWVHVVGLPFNYYIQSVGERLTSLFKGCNKVEIRAEEVSGKRFFRLRIQVNVSEPFRRVMLISSDNGKSCSRGLIQYERLPSLCYVCGLCDHTMDVCDVSKGELAESEQLPFGPWLNADRKSSLLDEFKFDATADAESETAAVESKTSESKTSRFVWKIEHFSQLDVKKMYSDVFYAGGYKWRVLLYPKGNSPNPKGNNVKCLSLYLDVADKASLPKGWSRNVHFSLAVVYHADNGTKTTLKKEFGHLFNQKASDWGSTSFMPLSQLNDPLYGFGVEDTVIVEAEVDLR